MYRILVCEDEKSIADALEIYLTNEGYEVLRAENGIEALEIVKKEELHLILMDIKYDGVKFVYDDYACERFKRNLVDSLGDLQRKYAIRESMIKSLDDLNG